MKSDDIITIYIDNNGLVTINIPRGVFPDKATIHRIWEIIQEEKEKASAGGQTDEGQSLN